MKAPACSSRHLLKGAVALGAVVHHGALLRLTAAGGAVFEGVEDYAAGGIVCPRCRRLLVPEKRLEERLPRSALIRPRSQQAAA